MNADTKIGIDELFLGGRVGPCRVESLRGHGQFGLVFAGVNEETGAPVAIKFLNPSRLQSVHLNDFEGEGRMLERLESCDGVVTLHDRGNFILPSELTGSPFEIVVPYQTMALAEGPLSDLCETPEARAQLSDLQRLQLWRSAALSMMRMHGQMVANRDVKAENCLLFFDKNGDYIVRFGDFGRGKDLSLIQSRPDDAYFQGRGDPFHAAPEAVYLQAGADAPDFVAADYYGLGSLLVELLTGQSMTRLSVTDVRGARDQAMYDLERGQVRDLAVLTTKHELVVESVANVLPKSVREDARVLLGTLCDPVPSRRLVRGPFGRDKNDIQPLTWVLRRIDIMIRRIKIDNRTARRLHGRTR
ncbi:protein kinase [Curtobacterium flaccumfaciens pv. flaccumfaciens]|uniref:protein kinase domain-containing protein n=1 Tax=Curtobacterium flaccumfaciens TaxID=2035 RepID=UPI00217D21DA|nr:protein kinase [Curtobacterium flaccumfaciens]MCS6548416.1 protein kinase [Curtobacterium flaccumfaciens pv. flaccumfaciens]